MLSKRECVKYIILILIFLCLFVFFQTSMLERLINLKFQTELNNQASSANSHKNEVTNCSRTLIGKVTIFTIVDSEEIVKTKYKDSIGSLKCYINQKEYPFILINPRTDKLTQEKCSQLKEMFFLKHCAASVYLNQTDWLVVLDADSGIINMNHCFEEYIDTKFDIIHQERFHNGEVAAGNYIARNTQFARNYLMEWALMENVSKANADNGALHYQLYKTLQLNKTKMCDDFLNVTWATYDRYVGCVKLAMNRTRVFEKIKIFRRGMSFVRDSWVTNHYWSEFDFALHAMKPPDNVHFTKTINPDDCFDKTYRLPIKYNLKVSVDKMKTIIRKSDAHHAKRIPATLFNDPDISPCWPECPDNL